MTIFVIKNFLSIDECNTLNAWVETAVQNKWLDNGLSMPDATWTETKRLTTRPYGDRFDYSPEVYAIQNKITNFLKIENLEKSVAGGGKNGIVVSYTITGGNVHKHIDPKEGELEVLRCNVVSKNSEIGGELFIGGEKIDIGVGDLHCYLPSDVEHYVTTTEGNTPRILWMFGYKCEKDRFDRLLSVETQEIIMEKDLT